MGCQLSPNGQAEEYTREKVYELLRNLQSTQYQERQRAFMQLWQAPPSIQPLLDEFSLDADLQCVTSAKWLMLLRKLGGSPGDASESLVNLGLVRVGDFPTLMRLAADHRWSQIVVLLELLDDEQRSKLVEDAENANTSLPWRWRIGKRSSCRFSSIDFIPQSPPAQPAVSGRRWLSV